MGVQVRAVELGAAPPSPPAAPLAPAPPPTATAPPAATALPAATAAPTRTLTLAAATAAAHRVRIWIRGSSRIWIWIELARVGTVLCVARDGEVEQRVCLLKPP